MTRPTYYFITLIEGEAAMGLKKALDYLERFQQEPGKFSWEVGVDPDWFACQEIYRRPA